MHTGLHVLKHKYLLLQQNYVSLQYIIFIKIEITVTMRIISKLRQSMSLTSVKICTPAMWYVSANIFGRLHIMEQNT